MLEVRLAYEARGRTLSTALHDTSNREERQHDGNQRRDCPAFPMLDCFPYDVTAHQRYNSEGQQDQKDDKVHGQ
ncbi:hypothetical protein [Mesorhizobium mediterraneum]|uniref:hypothetical protein n=1 Tax=Mesorhizobium mediterraneum TaxID=43617 RepID=UPI00177EF84B|nr:hypothetical protein [Mesorhizobium mediterraneum]